MPDNFQLTYLSRRIHVQWFVAYNEVSAEILHPIGARLLHTIKWQSILWLLERKRGYTCTRSMTLQL